MPRIVASALVIGLSETGCGSRQDGYPPYDVERIFAASGEPERLRITVAVAGFASDDLELRLEAGQLKLCGRRPSGEAAREFLHRGIAARSFQRTFPLAEGVEVLGAHLQNGLLTIDLARPDRQANAKRVDIAVRA